MKKKVSDDQIRSLAERLSKQRPWLSATDNWLEAERIFYHSPWKSWIVRFCGDKERSGWDWADLCIRVSVPVLAVGLSAVFGYLSGTSQRIADQNKQENDVLSTFFASARLLVLNDGNNSGYATGSKAALARATTLATLSELKSSEAPRRKGLVMRFIVNSGLAKARLPNPIQQCKDRIPEHSDTNSSKTSSSAGSNKTGLDETAGSIDLSGADLERADLSGLRLSDALLILKNANLNDALLGSANLSNVDLTMSKLTTKDLGEADLIESDLRFADLSGSRGTNVDFTCADMRYAHLANSAFPSSFFAGSYLTGASLRGADMQGSSFKNAQLGATDFSKANLRGAVMVGVNLAFPQKIPPKNRNMDTVIQDANFSQADLRGAELSGNFSRVNFSGSDLRGSDLSGAIIEDANLKDIRWDSRTRWPRLFKKAKNIPLLLRDS